MIAIRPVSDLQNKLTEIEEIVQQGDPVFLTKNGYGSMVVLSVEQYSALLDRAADAVKLEDGAPNAASAPADEDADEDADEASDGAQIHLKSHAPWCKPESPTLYVRKIDGFWTVMTEAQAACYLERNGESEDEEDEEDFWDEML